MTRYFNTAFSVGSVQDGGTVDFIKVSKEETMQWLRFGGFENISGHTASLHVLSERLKVNLHGGVDRQIVLQPGDEMLVAHLIRRSRREHMLTIEELRRMEFRYTLVRRVR